MSIVGCSESRRTYIQISQIILLMNIMINVSLAFRTESCYQQLGSLGKVKNAKVLVYTAEIVNVYISSNQNYFRYQQNCQYGHEGILMIRFPAQKRKRTETQNTKTLDLQRSLEKALLLVSLDGKPSTILSSTDVIRYRPTWEFIL